MRVTNGNLVHPLTFQKSLGIPELGRPCKISLKHNLFPKNSCLPFKALVHTEVMSARMKAGSAARSRPTFPYKRKNNHQQNDLNVSI